MLLYQPSKLLPTSGLPEGSTLPSLRSQGVLELLDLRKEGSKVLVRLREEVDQEATHAVGAGEGRGGITIEELGELLGTGDDRSLLLLKRVVGTLVHVVGRGNAGSVGLGVDDLSGARAQEREEGLGGSDVGLEGRRLCAEHVAVDRGVESSLGVPLRPMIRPREEVEVGEGAWRGFLSRRERLHALRLEHHARGLAE